MHVVGPDGAPAVVGDAAVGIAAGDPGGYKGKGKATAAPEGRGKGEADGEGGAGELGGDACDAGVCSDREAFCRVVTAPIVLPTPLPHPPSAVDGDDEVNEWMERAN